MILAPTNRRVIRPYDKPSFEHTQRYGLIKNHWANINRVGLWLFNEGSGNKVFDLSGNGNNGTFTGNPAWIGGKYGSTITFPGTDDYITMPDGSPPAFGTNDFTIISTVKCPQDNANKYILYKGGNIAGGFVFYKLSTDKLAFAGDSSSIFVVSGVNDSWPDDIWTQIGVTRRGSTVQLYMDGIKAGSADTSAGADLNDTSTWNIGGPILDYIGEIDHVVMWNRALSASEIAELFWNPFSGIERRAAPVYSFVPTGGVVYQELNLTVTAAASVAKTDVHAMVDTGKAVQANAATTESDTQQMAETGKEVSADASVSKTDTQQMVETGKAVEAVASVSCTDLKVVFELNLEVTASGSVAVTDAHTMIETGKSVTAVASSAVIDTQAMVETELGILADASVSCTDSMGLLAHIAAFMILRQCTT